MGTKTPWKAMAEQIEKLKRQAVEVVDEMSLTFHQADRVLRSTEFKERIEKEARKLFSTDLLELVTFVDLEEVKRFSVKDVIETGRIGSTRFRFCPTFQRIFGMFVETNVPPVTVKFSRVKGPSTLEMIREDLGGGTWLRVFLSHMFMLACHQGRNQEGFLLVKNLAHVIHPDDPERLWVADFSRSGDAWAVGLWPAKHKGVWPDCRQQWLSINSLVPPKDGRLQFPDIADKEICP